MCGNSLLGLTRLPARLEQVTLGTQGANWHQTDVEKLSVLKMSLLGWSKLYWPQRGNLRRTDLGMLFVVWDVAARLD